MYDIRQYWDSVKRGMTENAKIVKKSESDIQNILKDIIAVQTKVDGLIKQGEGLSSKLDVDMNGLRASSVAKYEAAEASAENVNKPLITGKLFQIAQNEAAILAEEEKGLKLFTESLADGTSVASQLEDIRSELSGIANDILEIQARQSESLYGMVEGVTASLQTCKESLNECGEKGGQGSDLFKKSEKIANKAQDSYFKRIQSFEKRAK